MITIAFRVEGGKNIGMGHVMRCISLAKEFIRQGCKVIFISSMIEARTTIEINGMLLVDDIEMDKIYNKDILSLAIDEIKEEVNCIKKILLKYQVSILILDSYNVTEQYMKLIKEFTKVFVYIDDVNKYPYPVDVIVNGNITGEFLAYPLLKKQKLLLGLKYNLIRDEFKGIAPKIVLPTIENIMITTGGSDPFNFTLEVLNNIIDYTIERNIKIHVIVGNSFQNEEQLSIFAEKYSNTILHRNVMQISKIMGMCDIAISSGGSTLYELCVCGVPTLAYIIADNQELIVKKMDELGFIISMGFSSKFNHENLLEKIEYLNSNVAYRISVSKKMQSLLDGNGTQRVVNNILGLTKT